jgi:RNA processing factor Prp31
MITLFAKLFEFPTGQLLVMTNTDADTGCEEIIFRTDINGLQVQQKLQFPVGQSSTEVFNKIDANNSLSTYNHLFNIGKDSSIDIDEPAYSTFNLAIQVENMRNAQNMYFKLIGKARKTKVPEDLDKAEKMKALAINLEALVDGSVKQVLQPVREVIG